LPATVKLFEGAKMVANFVFTDAGTFYLCEPMNDGARSHLTATFTDDPVWFADSLAVPSDRAAEIMKGLQDDGFSVVL
jgi:hypothetical protein